MKKVVLDDTDWVLSDGEGKYPPLAPADKKHGSDIAPGEYRPDNHRRFPGRGTASRV